jgi:hypothetical protein
MTPLYSSGSDCTCIVSAQAGDPLKPGCSHWIACKLLRSMILRDAAYPADITFADSPRQTVNMFQANINRTG